MNAGREWTEGQRLPCMKRFHRSFSIWHAGLIVQHCPRSETAPFVAQIDEESKGWLPCLPRNFGALRPGWPAGAPPHAAFTVPSPGAAPPNAGVSLLLFRAGAAMTGPSRQAHMATPSTCSLTPRQKAACGVPGRLADWLRQPLRACARHRPGSCWCMPHNHMSFHTQGQHGSAQAEAIRRAAAAHHAARFSCLRPRNLPVACQWLHLTDGSVTSENCNGQLPKLVLHPYRRCRLPRSSLVPLHIVLWQRPGKAWGSGSRGGCVSGWVGEHMLHMLRARVLCSCTSHQPGRAQACARRGSISRSPLLPQPKHAPSPHSKRTAGCPRWAAQSGQSPPAQCASAAPPRCTTAKQGAVGRGVAGEQGWEA